MSLIQNLDQASIDVLPIAHARGSKAKVAITSKLTVMTNVFDLLDEPEVGTLQMSRAPYLASFKNESDTEWKAVSCC